MTIQELSDHIQTERQCIAEILDFCGKTGDAYATAYGELNALCLELAIRVAKLDPAFDLVPVDAEQIAKEQSRPDYRIECVAEARNRRKCAQACTFCITRDAKRYDQALGEGRH